ncbi:hypothetical protein Franean1_0707 [Parafrankia sp. EAN1pec]|nr:hypothetical protein Franean1_0707 [Frankia sp. EAN1pec]
MRRRARGGFGRSPGPSAQRAGAASRGGRPLRTARVRGRRGNPRDDQRRARQRALRAFPRGDRRLLEAGAAEGTLKPEIDPEDVLLQLSVLWRIPPGAGSGSRAARILDLIIDGVRTRPPSWDRDEPSAALKSRDE